ncbi:MAG: hypothetical protein ABEK16_04255 [Candidatus Nanohalobium sp.]
MSAKNSVLASILVLMLLASPAVAISVNESKIGEILRQKCLASNSSHLEIDGNITLNGEEVERINCERLEEYNFPKIDSITPDPYSYENIKITNLVFSGLALK